MLGDYGFIIAYILQHVGTCTLLSRLCSRKSKEWISTDSLLCVLIANVVRFFVYLVTYDSLLDINNLECLVGLGLSGAALYFALRRNELRDMPSVSLPACYKFQVLVAIAAILALVLPPGVSSRYLQNASTGFFVYLESIALVPQIYLIKKEGNIGGFTSLYITLVGVSRGIRLLFWLVLILFGLAYFSLILADALHTFLVGQLMYEYIKSLHASTVLPFTEKKHLS